MSEHIHSNSSDSYIFTIGELSTMKGFSTVVKRAIERAYPYCNISLAPHMKNNGLTLLGLTITDMKYNLAPTFYLDSYFLDYKQGRSLESICERIIQMYEENRPDSSFPIEEYTTFDNISDCICYKLINYEANKTLLESMPYIPYLDLAIVFYLPIENDKLSGSVNITNSLMKAWNVTSAYTLLDYAQENTEKNLGFRYGTMSEIVNSIFPPVSMKEEFLELLTDDVPPIYIATNANNLYGSCCILYENALDIFAEMIGKNFYILPSSLHEVLLIPDDDADAAVLTAMVQDVNVTSLSPDEILSNHVYYYDESRKKLVLCTRKR